MVSQFKVNTGEIRSKLIIVFLFFFFLLGIIQPACSITWILLKGQLPDFEVYFQAAKAVLNGVSPYGNEAFTFNYPPTSLFLFIPFSLIPLFSGQIAWTIFSALCLGLAVYLLFKSLKWKPKLKEFLFLIPLITLSFPVKWTFGMGQIGSLILLLLVITFVFYQEKKDLFAGISLGSAIVLKLSPLLLLGLFLLKREWKLMIKTLIFVMLVNFLAVLVFGTQLTKDYFLKLGPSLVSPQGKWTYYNQALSSFVVRLIGEGHLAFLLTTFFSFLILGIIFALSIRSKKVNHLNYSLVIISFLLVNSFSWQHHFVLMVFPFLTVFNFLKKRKTNNLSWLVLLTSYFLVAFNLKNPAVFQSSFLGPVILSHVFFGALILFAMIVYYLIKENG